MVLNGSPVWWRESTLAGTCHDPRGRTDQSTCQVPTIEITNSEASTDERRGTSSPYLHGQLPCFDDAPPPYKQAIQSYDKHADTALPNAVMLQAAPTPRRRAISTASTAAAFKSADLTSKSKSKSAPSSPRSSSPTPKSPKSRNSIAVAMGMSTVAAMAVGIGYAE